MLSVILIAAQSFVAPYYHVPEPPPLPGTEWAIGRDVAEVRARIPETWRVTEGVEWIDVDLPACRMTLSVHGTDQGPVIDGLLPMTHNDRFLTREAQQSCITAFSAVR